MAHVMIEDGCAQLGAVSVSDDFRWLTISVSDRHGTLSEVKLYLDAKENADDARRADEGPQQLALRVRETLCVLIQRAWEVSSKRVEKGEPSL